MKRGNGGFKTNGDKIVNEGGKYRKIIPNLSFFQFLPFFSLFMQFVFFPDQLTEKTLRTLKAKVRLP